MIMTSNVCVSLSITLILSVIFVIVLLCVCAHFGAACSQADCVFDEINYKYYLHDNSKMRSLSSVDEIALGIKAPFTQKHTLCFALFFIVFGWALTMSASTMKRLLQSKQ